MKTYQLFATTPKAMEALLANELEQLGAKNLNTGIAGVGFSGTLETAYRICLWSRCANRVLLILDNFQVREPQDIYAGIQAINWHDHLEPNASLAVSFSSKNNRIINNAHFGALKVKDAIIDQFRDRFGERPKIDTARPDLRVNVYLHGTQAQVAIDLSGDSLHKRGYRDINVPAPIKENLAAAMLLRSNWTKIAAKGGSLIDPMCGSGTLLIEAALIAADIAPGLLREYFGFLRWKQHIPELWQVLLDEASERKAQGLKRMPIIVGFDQHRRAINAARQHIERAGLTNKVHLEKRDINLAEAADSWEPGLLICNPPYGARLSDEPAVLSLYQQFGDILKQRFLGWHAAMIVSNPEYGFRLGIRSQKPITLYNGAIECKLLRMHINDTAFFTPKALDRQQKIKDLIQTIEHAPRSDGAVMFHNRLSKNLKTKNKWAKRNQIECYRVYDADLPEYAMAIDVYQCDPMQVHVQEYQAPKDIDENKADARLAEALAEIAAVMQITDNQVHYKVRKKQKASEQYEKLDQSGRFYPVREGGCRFYVNFEDYLDTGLFLDHRPVRLMLQQQSAGKHFLNLFAYTGSATVHAAAGGAKSTTSVDMSKTYLDWIQKNLELNKIKGDHHLIHADCTQWLKQQARLKQKRYDLIFLDPPTFSNSKRMEQSFDVQNDHIELINNAMQLLRPKGTLYFSTNFRRFKLDNERLKKYKVQDISAATIPEDFSRTPKIHYCWRIQA